MCIQDSGRGNSVDARVVIMKCNYQNYQQFELTYQTGRKAYPRPFPAKNINAGFNARKTFSIKSNMKGGRVLYIAEYLG
jgi:hypothetical protein